MDKVYANLVKLGWKTIDEVPPKHRDAVKKILGIVDEPTPEAPTEPETPAESEAEEPTE